MSFHAARRALLQTLAAIAGGAMFSVLAVPGVQAGGLVADSVRSAASAQSNNAEPVPPSANVDDAVQALMREYDVAGLAIAVTREGRHEFRSYGVASLQTHAPVGPDTLFEVGSISKTFTATLATYAQVLGKLTLEDSPARFVPALKGTEFGKLNLIHLGTHTGGGFPLQVPDAVKDDAQLMAYLAAWTPRYAPGTTRTYANPSIGMLGVVAAKSLEQPFAQAMEQTLLPKLGLANTYINVPAAKMSAYAQGYNKQNAPVRVNPGVLAAEAYGIKTSASDLIRFVDANMGVASESRMPGRKPNVVNAEVAQALAATHVGYYEIGPMTQDLAWEQLAYPVTLDDLLTANAGTMNSQSQPARALNPPQAPRGDVWINKTGSTNGFGAYVAFVPARKIGVVILANRNIPNEARVRLAYRILEAGSH
ncbi:Beta-lactamase [Achromobacter piechaudii]|uniref:Beta-lactamase n=2 Tax=Achromobacter piechaudii TaxID=72556 RepID=A0ABN7EZ78_9BURK|nr:class C beta-lactamase [Achromobacter piechaudii]CAB3699871.1 Beta-lactamase [Achromobacter piechaudii]CAB3852602.1 Beta-lactamase [Achromobacter piechaudii]CAB3950747.1 Beta-lactamase [Achromobacter piechaudii]